MNKTTLESYMNGLLAEIDAGRKAEKVMKDLLDTHHESIGDWIDGEVEKVALSQVSVREIIEVVVCKDSLREIMPRVEYGFYAEGGCKTYEEVLENVQLEFDVYHDEHPEDCPVLGYTCKCGEVAYITAPLYTFPTVEAASRLIWEDVQEARIEAEEGVDDADSIRATEEWINKGLVKQNFS